MTDTEYTNIKALEQPIHAEIRAAILLAQDAPEKALRHFDSARKKMQAVAQRIYEAQQRDLLSGGRNRP